MMLIQVIEYIQLSFGHAYTTKTKPNLMKTPGNECGWYIGKQIFMLLLIWVMALVRVPTWGIVEKL
jgi:hypothetical protein